MLTVSLVFSTVVMLLDGLFYLVLGLCMIFPLPLIPLKWGVRLAQLYPSLFRDYPAFASEGLPTDESHGLSNDGVEERVVAVRRLDQRILGYLLFVLGFCRVITSFYWGCGYIIMGLCTCLAEIGMLCNEMLQHESVRIHGTMAVVLHHVFVSLLYIGCALPYCK
jgi:hypothetical protein